MEPTVGIECLNTYGCAISNQIFEYLDLNDVERDYPSGSDFPAPNGRMGLY